MFELLPSEIKYKILDYLNITLTMKKVKNFEYYAYDCAVPKVTKYIITDYTNINKELYKLIKLKKCECCALGVYINNKCNNCGYCLSTHYLEHTQKYINIHNNYLNNQVIHILNSSNISIGSNKKMCLHNHKMT